MWWSEKRAEGVSPNTVFAEPEGAISARSANRVLSEVGGTFIVNNVITKILLCHYDLGI